MGEDLKFIDFHQLQIENKKHVKDIDDRNNKLLILKVSAANTVLSLNELKNKLLDAEHEEQEIEKDLQLKEQSKIKQLNDIKNTSDQVSALKHQIKKQEAIIAKFKGEMADPLMFVDQRNSYMQLKQCHRNWVRKIEIAELEGKKAKAILKKHGIPWDDNEDIEHEQ